MSPFSPARRSRVLLALALATSLAACSTPSTPVGSRIPSYETDADQPAPFDTSAFNFLVVGDWGRNGYFNQSDVARAMGQTGEQIDSRFTISTGDNFYLSGVTGLDDPRWDRSYENIYTAPSLQSRWYVVLGNHDWYGNVPAQVRYTQQSDRWYLPGQYYAQELSFGDPAQPEGATRVLFVYLDTTPLTTDPSARGRFSQTGVWNDDSQVAWLDETLSRSTAPWKIVVGHHPVYVGSNRYSDNPRLVANLVPIFERTGVQAYVAGHDHNLQHHRPAGSPVDYFVSGAGSLTREVRQTGNTLFAFRTAGFMAFSMTRNQMSVRSLDYDGNLVYEANVPRTRGRRLPLPFGLGEGS